MERVLQVNFKKIHFVGIGGIGMSGLATLLLDKGYTISGSDVRENSIIEKLRNRGVKINIPHRASCVKGADLVCFSSAVDNNNPEIKKAKALKLPIIRRGVLLGKILRGKKVLAVAGSHGKTTVTSLASFVLQKAGRDIASLVGGIPLYSENSSWWGKDLFVVETDESDASFLNIMPTCSIITNIDREHLNFYGSFKKLKDAFLKFTKNTDKLLIGCAQQGQVYELLKKSKKDFISYGLNRKSMVQARNIRLLSNRSCFDVFYKDKFAASIALSLLGEHNILNALSVIAFCLYLGYDLEKISKLFGKFPGTKRRLEFRGRIKNVMFIDDYAHHPREIEAVVNAVSAIKKKRLVVMFQPHRFSRIKDLISEFSSCFKNIDLLIITDIYAASEPEIKGIDAHFLIKKVKKYFKNSILYIPKQQLSAQILPVLRKGDCFLSLGAGDISRIQEQIREHFRKK